MKEITLPLRYKMSVSVDPSELDNFETGDITLTPHGTRQKTIASVTQDDYALLETARKNGGILLHATSTIDAYLNSIIKVYFMGSNFRCTLEGNLFERELLKSSVLTFSAKKELTKKIVHERMLLNGKERNNLQRLLKLIMKWRNAFAHGELEHNNIKGCRIQYYSGGKQTETLTDEFWENIESWFFECEALLQKADEANRNHVVSSFI